LQDVKIAAAMLVESPRRAARAHLGGDQVPLGHGRVTQSRSSHSADRQVAVSCWTELRAKAAGRLRARASSLPSMLIGRPST
jgi:hypothetical protein